MFATLITALALAQYALAGVYVTNPTASAAGTGGQVLSVSWADDGNTPRVAEVGPSSIDIYTGSRTQQYRLQNLAASVDVSKASSINATVDPAIGPSGAYYFIRFTSLGLKDSAQPQYNYQSYSARFTLNNMSGTFNSTVQATLADINGSSVVVSSSSSSSKSASATATPTKSNSTAAGAAVTTSAAHSSISFATPTLMALVILVASFMSL